MDFDEYEYLERMVEDVDLPQESNGVGGVKRKSNEDGLSRDGDSKKLKDDGYSSRRDKSDRDKDKDRDRDRDRDRNKDKDRAKDKTDKERPLERSDRDSKGREKDKERHRDRDRERYGERDRDREKPRDRAREHDRDRDRDRERSISKSRHHEKERDNGRSREKEKTRERDVERVRESRERVRESREREREREDARRSRERKEKEQSAPKEPEVDLERDQRTVFAYQMCLKADEHDVYEFFSRAGKVRDVRLIMDRNSRRSKGVGYIEFYDAMSVPVAIALSGQLLRGQPVMVKPSEAEKNLAQSTATPAVGSTGAYSVGARRLYVGNLHFNITEDQLRQVFEPFGTVELVQLPRDLETGHCKGFGFVQYARLEDARSAQQALNGVLELAGRIIKVSSISDQAGIPDGGIATGELDDDEGGGLSLTARSRVLLMQKLDRSGAAPSIPAPAMAAPIGNSPFGLLGSSLPNAASIVSPLVGAINPAVLPGLAGLANPLIAEPVGAPTDCLLLKNMFDPTTETEPDFDLDIKEDVQQECSKFGTIKHIFVDKHSSGHVYLRFDNVTSAMNAQRALHGRWFAGKMITTQFWTPQAYEAKFPDSR